MEALGNDFAIKQVNSNVEPKWNIILILSESLWDLTIVDGLQFSEEPFSFYHSIADDYPSGKMDSSQFGGGTVNVEFEVLIGNC